MHSEICRLAGPPGWRSSPISVLSAPFRGEKHRKATAIAPMHGDYTMQPALRAVAFLLAFPFSAAAQDYDICTKILDDTVLSPPNFVTRKVCKAEGAQALYCLLNPICCSRACLASPDCVVTRQVAQTIDFIRRGDDVACFRTDAAEYLYQNWKAGAVEIVMDGLTAGASDALIGLLAADAEAIYARADELPPHVKSLLAEIVAPVHDGGATGYGHHHLRDVRIIPESEALDTDLWHTMGAITLGELVILSDPDFVQLMDRRNIFDLTGLLFGRATAAYSEAVATMVHEIVHVKQYAQLGKRRFFADYVFENLPGVTEGYGFGPYEQEAYRFTAEITRHHGGLFCEQTREQRNNDIDRFSLPIDPIVCDLSLVAIPAVMLLLAG